MSAAHEQEWHHSGDGYTAPREDWLTCTCGALIWEYYQGAGSNPEGVEPDEAWQQHAREDESHE